MSPLARLVDGADANDPLVISPMFEYAFFFFLIAFSFIVSCPIMHYLSFQPMCIHACLGFLCAHFVL